MLSIPQFSKKCHYKLTSRAVICFITHFGKNYNFKFGGNYNIDEDFMQWVHYGDTLACTKVNCVNSRSCEILFVCNLQEIWRSSEHFSNTGTPCSNELFLTSMNVSVYTNQNEQSNKRFNIVKENDLRKCNYRTCPYLVYIFWTEMCVCFKMSVIYFFIYL